MKKTVVSILLVALLIASLFVLTGCVEKKEENKTENNNATTTNNQTATVETTDFYIQNLVPDCTVKEAYASPAGQNAWSPNLINGLEMATGTQAKIGIGLTEGATTYDFKMVDEQGQAVIFPSVDLSSIFANKGGSVALQLDEENNPIAVAK